MANRWENNENSERLYFGGSKITADGDCSCEIKRRLLLGRKAMTNLDSILKSRDITLPTKFHLVKTMVFPSNHVWMWELDHKEGWVPKNWCFWTAVLEKTLENNLNCKKTQPVHSKGDQSWVFFWRNDAKAETPVVIRKLLLKLFLSWFLSNYLTWNNCIIQLYELGKTKSYCL